MKTSLLFKGQDIRLLMVKLYLLPVSSPLEPSINRKRRQDQDHSINNPPNKRDPRAHLKVPALIDASQ